MALDPNVLFPDLPPELRNEIYTYLSTPRLDAQPLSSHIPLQLKTFTCKHTTVQICPVHHGSTGLLALPRERFLEAREYQSWLLNNALELHISVHFKGRINTFAQEHWDKKMQAHLRKLAKLHPWLNKVAHYNINILWAPLDGALKSKNNKRIAGHVPLDMATTLTQLMYADVRRKQARIRLGLHLDHSFAVANAMAPAKFGLAAFLMGKDHNNILHGFRNLTRDVWKTPCTTFSTLQSPALPSSSFSTSLVMPPTTPQDEPLIAVDEGLVKWSARTQGQLVMRKSTNTMGCGGSGCADGVYEYGNGDMEFPVCQILAECVERL
jgi:hypothetical protein